MVKRKDNIEQKVDRRRFLFGTLGLVGFLGLGVGGALYVFNRRTDDNKLLEEFNRETEANRWLEEFPLQIPGAREIRKYRTEGAKHCLVHILQRHYLFGLKTNKKREDFLTDDIKDVQRDIYTILSYLIDNCSLKDVYDEGVVSENIDYYDNMILKFWRKYEESLSPKARLDKVQVVKKFQEDNHKFLERIGSIPGAVLRLALEKKVILKAAETIEVNKLINKDDKKWFPNEKNMDEREDALFKLIGDSGNSIGVVVYGGGHAWGGKQSFGESYSLEGRISWKDNIYEWNLKNPNKKFSLIEVVPSSYRFGE